MISIPRMNYYSLVLFFTPVCSSWLGSFVLRMTSSAQRVLGVYWRTLRSESSTIFDTEIKSERPILSRVHFRRMEMLVASSISRNSFLCYLHVAIFVFFFVLLRGNDAILMCVPCWAPNTSLNREKSRPFYTRRDVPSSGRTYHFKEKKVMECT